MIQKTEYVLEVISSSRKSITFRCPPDCPRGERVDILSQMLNHEIGEVKIEADKLKSKIPHIKEGVQ